MSNDVQRSVGHGGTVIPRTGKGSNRIFSNSFKAFSSYLRIVSSGASSVASSVRSAASAIVERDSEINHEQVLWAGFDQVELERGVSRQLLLLGYSYGFQVWDVETADNVNSLVSRHDGPVCFMQMSPKPLVLNKYQDKFVERRPLLVICADESFSGGDSVREASDIPCGASIQQCNEPHNDGYVPTVVWFYSLISQSYVHLLRFRSVVHLVRCSPRVVAVLQSSQIHCFNAATLEREYTILTNPIAWGSYGAGNFGFGPLAVGPRWMAYSGSQVEISDSGCVSPQQVSPAAGFDGLTSNGSFVVRCAKESGKQLASGLVTLGDMGYKKLSRYYSELLPEGNTFQSGPAGVNLHGDVSEHSTDTESVGMVIVRDIVSKTVITQFRAHKSPILLLCFNPNGTLLVTASVQGHNINVFRIMPEHSGGSSRFREPSYIHLYRLQRGFTNAVIQDISFSVDSQWIMISSSRGTSHLFSVSSSGDYSISSVTCNRNSASSLMTKPSVMEWPDSRLQMLTEQSISGSGPPFTLCAVSRIRNGNNGWRNTVSDATAAATGRVSSFSGAIAATFHYCKGNDTCTDTSSLKKYHHLLVFSPSGSLIQYALRLSPIHNGMTALPGARASWESGLDCDVKLTVDAIQKWHICQKQHRMEREDNIDFFGDIGNPGSSKVYPERMRKEKKLLSDVMGMTKNNKTATEERLHMYISEAELQMHQTRNPLWLRYEVYFQSMLINGCNMEDDGGCGGEIEIEKIPVCILEARVKGLVPVFDNLQGFQLERIPLKTPAHNHLLISDVSEDGKHPRGQSGPHLNTDIVNTNNVPAVNDQLYTVNTIENSESEPNCKD